MNAEEIIKKYKLKREWTPKGFHAILHTFSSVQETVFHPSKNYFGDSATIVVMFIKDDYLHWYWFTEDMDRLRKFAIKQVNKNSNFLKDLVDEWHKRVELFKEQINKVENSNLSSLNDKELLNIYQDFHNAYLYEYGIAVVIQDAFSMNADRFMKPELKKILGNESDKLEEYYATLTSPITESFILTEYKERLDILKLIKEKGLTKKEQLLENPEIKEKLKIHSKNFFWVQNNYAKMDVLDVNYFAEKIIGELNINPD